ncbi:MAG: dTDP-4-dehydrorhamnose 3,5-epimerase family protein [bacterium]
MIDGVEIKELKTYPDERGFFREVIRMTDVFFTEGFGQFSHSIMYAGVAKAWHVHKTQVDWWYVPVGNIKVVLHDKREDSSTAAETVEIFLGENYGAKVLKIPPGVAHGCKVLGSVAHLFYITSKVYNRAEEGRLPHDDPKIGYDWEAGPEIK